MRKRACGTTGNWWLGTAVLVCAAALAVSVCGCSCAQSLDAPAAGNESAPGDDDATTTTMTETAGLESTTTTSQPAPATTSTTASSTTTTFGFVPLQPTITVAPVPEQWQHLDDGAGALRYTGTWTAVLGTQVHPGYRQTDQSGAEVEITIDGTRFRLISMTGPGMGRAKLTIDSMSPVYVDLYDPQGSSETVWTSGILAHGIHTLTIEWSGIKSPAATGTTITVDAIEVIGAVLL